MITSFSQARTQRQTSIAAIAKRWPGPMASVLTRSMVAADGDGRVDEDFVPVAALLVPVRGTKCLIDGKHLSIGDLFVRAEVEVAAGPATW